MSQRSGKMDKVCTKQEVHTMSRGLVHIFHAEWKKESRQNADHATMQTTGSPSSMYKPDKEHNIASNYKGLYGIFYKIFMEEAKSENSQLKSQEN